VVLAALTMGLTFADTLGLPQKLGDDAARWTRIQHSLYRSFGVIGGPIEVAAVVVALCARGRPAGRLATVGAASLVVALAVWFVVVDIANAEVGAWAVGAVPSDWGALASPMGVRARRAVRADPWRVPGPAAGHGAASAAGRTRPMSPMDAGLDEEIAYAHPMSNRALPALYLYGLAGLSMQQTLIVVGL
jgi:hypothetical protein